MSTNSSLPSYCPHCGASVNSTSTTCAVCGKSLLTFNQTGNQSNTYYPPLEEDIPSMPFNVLAFFIPVVGVVLYALWSGQYPRKSKAVGKWALIGFLAPLLIGLLFMVLFFMIALLSFGR
jgi:predicted amidophosphoribosyltransferase